MKHTLRRLINLSMVLVLLSLGACGYKKFENDSAQLKTTGAELLIEYQRRTAVVTNLLNLLKAQQNFDQPKWTAVMEARDKAMAIDAVPDLLNDAQKLEKYQQAQSDVTSAVTQLLAVSESNAELRANPTFIDVQAQLASVDNRIQITSERYVKVVQDYNTAVQTFPSNITAYVLGYKERPYFTVDVPSPDRAK